MRRGFTLVDMMIVVAIIGVLAAIAVPAFQLFACRAKQSEAKKILSDLEDLLEATQGEHGGNPSFTIVAQGCGVTDGIQLMGNKRFGYQMRGSIRHYQWLYQESGTGYLVSASGCGAMAGDAWDIPGRGAEMRSTVNICSGG